MKKYEYFFEFVDDIVINEMRDLIKNQKNLNSINDADKKVWDAAKVILDYYK